MQVSQMIKYAATATDVRKNKIMAMMDHFNHNASPVVHAFGLRIGHNFIKAHMRLLPPPVVEFYNRKCNTVFNGQWRLEKFLKVSANGSQKFRIAIIYDPLSKCNIHELQGGKNKVYYTYVIYSNRNK